MKTKTNCLQIISVIIVLKEFFLFCDQITVYRLKATKRKKSVLNFPIKVEMFSFALIASIIHNEKEIKSESRKSIFLGKEEMNKIDKN